MAHTSPGRARPRRSPATSTPSSPSTASSAPRPGGCAGVDDRSVLDLVADDTRALKDRVGQDDRRKLDEYLDSVRAVEERIAYEASDRRARYRDDVQARKDIEALGGRVDTYKHDPGRFRERSMYHSEHVRLMLDILRPPDRLHPDRHVHVRQLGEQQELLVRRERERRTPRALVPRGRRPRSWPSINASRPGTSSSALPPRPDEAGFREGEGTLLDHAMVLCGSALRDGNSHNPHDLPTVLAGRAGRTLSPGRHLVYGKDTPLCNLCVSMLNRVGVPRRAVRRQHRPPAGARQSGVLGAL